MRANAVFCLPRDSQLWPRHSDLLRFGYFPRHAQPKWRANGVQISSPADLLDSIAVPASADSLFTLARI